MDMLKNQPDKAQLTIASEERLSPDMLGIGLRVKVLDQAKQPVNGQPFKIHMDDEVLVQGATDENGEYSGQRILNVRKGMQRKVFLVLEGSATTDWKVIGGQKQEEEPAPDVAEIPNYVFWARMKDFTTTIKLPAHPQSHFDEDHFIKLLAGQISLTKNEKKIIIRDMYKLRQKQVDELIRVFDEERRKFIELSPKHSVQLKELEDKAAADWRELEMEYEDGKGSQGSEDVTTDTESTFEGILNGNRAVKKGETVRLHKETYTVTGDILIEEGGVMVIEPGANLEFNEACGIICKGKLVAVGTKENLVSFRPARRFWSNITLSGPGTLGSQFEYCIIEGGLGGKCTESDRLERLDGHPFYDPSNDEESVDAWGGFGGALLFLYTDPEFRSESQRKITVRNVICRNNRAGKGGALYCYRSSPLIEDCQFQDNSLKFPDSTFVPANRHGGGVYLSKSNARIRRTSISGNQTFMHGGGVYILDSDIVMEDCSINDNDCIGNTSAGTSGLFISNSRLRLTTSSVKRNGLKKLSKRGGIYIGEESEVNMTGCTLSENSAEYWRGRGGGIYVDSSRLEMEDCVFQGNRAKVLGGAIYAVKAQLKVTKCTIEGNATELTGISVLGTSGERRRGGGISAENSSLDVRDSKILGNLARDGGGIDAVDSTVTIVTSVVRGNRGVAGLSGIFSQGEASVINIIDSDVQED